MQRYGLALFTIREAMAQNWRKTLEKVADMGYRAVEFAGFGGVDPKELKKAVEELGLEAPSNHSIGFENLEKDLRYTYEKDAELGVRFCVCPCGKSFTRDEYLRAAELLNRQGETAKQFGLQLLYHNHAREFTSFDGQYGLDIIFENTDPALVQAEIDTYWVAYSGVDTVSYLKKYAGRLPLIHLKDLSIHQGEKIYSELGEGCLDIPSFLHAAEECGTLYSMVEQDACLRDPMDSISISMSYLRRMEEK